MGVGRGGTGNGRVGGWEDRLGRVFAGVSAGLQARKEMFSMLRCGSCKQSATNPARVVWLPMSRTMAETVWEREQRAISSVSDVQQGKASYHSPSSPPYCTGGTMVSELAGGE